MMPLRLIIAEDDILHYKMLKRIVQAEFPHLRIVGHCASVQELGECILAETPDILLADVQIHGGTVFDALRKVEENPDSCHTIILSAQSDFRYTQAALRLGATDYLTKPYNAEDVIVALQKVIAKCTGTAQAAAALSLPKQELRDKAVNSSPAPNAAEVLYLRDGQDDIVVPLVGICYVEADNHHVVIHTVKGMQYRYRVKFCEFIQRLSEYNFVQTHKSYAVALKHIEKLVPEFAVVYREGKQETKVPIARRYASEVKKAWRTFRFH